MTWLRELGYRLRHLLERSSAEQDLLEEVESHIELQTQEYVSQGLSPEQARGAARLKFGNATLAREDSRRIWTFRWLEDLGQDLRFASRSFRKSPGSTVAAAATLALGLGIGVAVFSVVNAVLFKPLPYEDPDRLVMVWSVNEKEGVDLELARAQGRSMSTSELEDWQKSGVFESMVAFGPWTPILYDPGDPEAIHAYSVSPGFFEMTGGRPFLGRGFTPEEEEEGSNVAVITYEFWKRRFQGDPAVIGRKLVIQNRNRMTAKAFPRSRSSAYCPQASAFSAGSRS